MVFISSPSFNQALYMPSELKGNSIFPFTSMATNPPSPPNFTNLFFTTSSQACFNENDLYLELNTKEVFKIDQLNKTKLNKVDNLKVSLFLTAVGFSELGDISDSVERIGPYLVICKQMMSDLKFNFPSLTLNTKV